MPAQQEYLVTIIDSPALPYRLAHELSFTAQRIKKIWPEVRRHPLLVAQRAAIESWLAFRRLLATPNASIAIVAGLLVISAAMLALFAGGKTFSKTRQRSNGDESLVLAHMIEFPASSSESNGVGQNSSGRIGFNHGKGEGSNSQRKSSHGGGSGGLRDLTDAQSGRLPLPSRIPAPIPKQPLRTKPALPSAGIDLDVALWTGLPFPNYGDPRSKSTTPSNGRGDGGGMGNVNGTGVGDGLGPGVGPGHGGNIGGDDKGIGGPGIGGSDGNQPIDRPRVFSIKEVSQRARVLSKPEPQYTEEARKQDVTGTVVLRVVFSSAGEVTNIHAMQSLPCGLTEKAIAAAKRIQFLPAMKDGKPVSVFMQLEYNFNLY
jgi:TonB family protein